MTDFKNKNVLITGAASGIGKLMAQKMAGLGANLFLWDLNESSLGELRTELQAAGSKAFAYTCDLSDNHAVRSTAGALLSEHGHIDILVNNAGIVTGKLLQEASDEEIELTFKVNALALFWTTRAFLPAMIERNSGHIVTIASAGGIVGTSRLVDYSATKHAAVGFNESLRFELKRQKSNIKTTVVCPFYINTGMFDGVKTRVPLLMPILTPEYAVKRIVNAIRKNHPRLVMPRFVMASYPMRIFPTAIFDAVISALGINNTMDEFTGRAKSKKQLQEEVSV